MTHAFLVVSVEVLVSLEDNRKSCSLLFTIALLCGLCDIHFGLCIWLYLSKQRCSSGCSI